MNKIIKDKIFIFFKNNWPIVLIILFGFAFRICGIYFDYPWINFIWDETYDLSYIFDILQKRTFFIDPPSSTYPLVLPLLYFPTVIIRLAYLCLKFKLFTTTNLINHLVGNGMGQIFIIGRWYAVAFGSLTIGLVYLAIKKIFNNKFASYFAALAYAVSLLPVFISHWGKHHSVMVFFFIISLLLSLYYEETKQIKFFYLAVIAAALCFSVHYVGLSATIFPAVCLLQNIKKFNIKKVLLSALIYLGIILIMYLPNYHGIMRMWYLMNTGYYSQNGLAISSVGKWERFYYVFRDYFRLDPVFLTLFLFSLLFNLKKLWQNKLSRYLIAGLSFNYLLMITIITGPNMSRWLLVFATLSVPMAAAWLYLMLSKMIKKEIAVFCICLLFLLPSFYITWHWDMHLRNNTEIQAAGWIEKNINSNEIIYSFDYHLNTAISYQAALWNRDNNQMQNMRKNNFIIEHKELFLNKGINLYYDKFYNRFKELGGKKTDYLVFSYSQKNQLDEWLKNIQKFNKIILVITFAPSDKKEILERGTGDNLNNPLRWQDIIKINASGPFVSIYKIIK